ncbi:hypothetical protein BC834DRAFT_784815, partial [Gloeopeniophorella convolvens]
EATAALCARFISCLFACPPPLLFVPPHNSASVPRLHEFIAYALRRASLPPSVTFAALYLLLRLKVRFPAAKRLSGQKLFISSFAIASKVICDHTYKNKDWCIISQGTFALRKVNWMERELCSYLEWELNIHPAALREFEAQVRRDFAETGP